MFSVGRIQTQTHGEVSFIHEFENDRIGLSSSFISYPDSTFEVTGAEPYASAITGTVGLAVEYQNNMSFFIDYTTIIADEQDVQMISGGLSWSF